MARLQISKQKPHLRAEGSLLMLFKNGKMPLSAWETLEGAT